MPGAVDSTIERRLEFLRCPAIRVGIYAGVALSVIFIAWVVVANRVPISATFATERNVIAAILLVFCAAVPGIRFLRSPGELLLSGLLAWGIFTLSYLVLCEIFVLLGENYSAFHVFVMGAIVYLLFSTLSWIGTIVWRVRTTDHSQPHH